MGRKRQRMGLEACLRGRVWLCHRLPPRLHGRAQRRMSAFAFFPDTKHAGTGSSKRTSDTADRSHRSVCHFHPSRNSGHKVRKISTAANVSMTQPTIASSMRQANGRAKIGRNRRLP